MVKFLSWRFQYLIGRQTWELIFGWLLWEHKEHAAPSEERTWLRLFRNGDCLWKKQAIWIIHKLLLESEGVKKFQVVEIVGKGPGKYLSACPIFRRWYNFWCAWNGKIMESNGVRWGFQRQSASEWKALCPQTMSHFKKELSEAQRLILKWLQVGAYSKRRKKRGGQ